MNIIVLGGDGFCGWPTALHLKNIGHNVVIFDNYSRRDVSSEMSSPSLTKIAEPWERSARSNIEFVHADITDFGNLRGLLQIYAPDVIVHFAEQRSAPWSMIDANHQRVTVSNNVVGTANVLAAVQADFPDIHLVHLGTMGVYGYNTTQDALPEGYVDVTVGGNYDSSTNTTVGGTRLNVVYPPDPGSVYHMTKVLDNQMFQFYAKNWNMRITDLHQGIVWGTQTKDTKLHPELINRFDYDGEYGTVLNRFLMQAASGIPLTVYGTGGQTRAFIHIQDTVRCVEAAINSGNFEPNHRPRVFNQITETLTVRDLANLIADRTGATIANVDNPRREKAENELSVVSTLHTVGDFKPLYLQDNVSLMDEVDNIVRANIHNVDFDKVNSKASWYR